MKPAIFLSLVLLSFNSSILFAQNKELAMPPEAVKEAPQEETFVLVEQMPEFPGGTDAMMHYLSSKVKYPEESRKMGVEGKVYVRFTVEKTGDISKVSVIRGIPDGELLEKEAVRVVSAMPKWTPGMQKGKAVNVYLTLPIAFALTAPVEENK